MLLIDRNNKARKLVNYSDIVNNLIIDNTTLFCKKKFGVFKNDKNSQKYAKKLLNFFTSSIKNYEEVTQFKSLKRKTKIYFFKKLNKFLFRDGRKILMKNLNFKKHCTQKIITKKIQNWLKQNWLKNATYRLNNLVTDCNIFYSIFDVNYYIHNFGVILNSKIKHNSKDVITTSSYFRLMLSINLLKYLLRQKKNIKLVFKKIKLYKYRIKNRIFKDLNKWLKLNEFVTSCVFLSNFSKNTLEFNLKSFSGVFFYKNSTNFLYYTYLQTDLTLFMNRSYNWKYLT